MKRLIVLAVLILVFSMSLSAAQVLSQQSEEEYYRAALEFIEANRKTDVTVKVVDSITGKPISGATVDYTQLAQAFLFSVDASTSQADLRSRLDLGATWYKVPGIEWSGMESARGSIDFAQVDRTLRAIRDSSSRAQFWAEARILTRQADGNYTAPGFVNFGRLDDSAVLDSVKASVYNFTFRLVSRYGGTIRHWMTQAELNAPGSISISGAPKISGEVGIQLVSVMVKAIKDANPGAVVIVGTVRPPFRGTLKEPFMIPEAFLDALTGRGVSVDALGINAGVNEGNPATHYEYIDKLAGLGKPVFVYATSFPSRGNTTNLPAVWATPTEDSQSDWARLMFVYAYGKRNVLGIHWSKLRDDPLGENGLVKADGTAKKVFQTVRQLLRQFVTAGTGRTDSTGALAFKGHTGRYGMTVTAFGFDRWSEEGNVGGSTSNLLTVTMPRYYTFYQARILLNLAKEKLDEAKGSGFLAPVSGDMLAAAETEYALAVAAFEQNDYSLSMRHADDSLALVRLAFYTELKFKQARLASSFETPTTLITFLALVGAFAVSMLYITSKSDHGVPEWDR